MHVDRKQAYHDLLLKRGVRGRGDPARRKIPRPVRYSIESCSGPAYFKACGDVVPAAIYGGGLLRPGGSAAGAIEDIPPGKVG